MFILNVFANSGTGSAGSGPIAPGARVQRRQAERDANTRPDRVATREPGGAPPTRRVQGARASRGPIRNGRTGR